MKYLTLIILALIPLALVCEGIVLGMWTYHFRRVKKQSLLGRGASEKDIKLLAKLVKFIFVTLTVLLVLICTLFFSAWYYA